MPVFVYQAADRRGQKIDGVMEAPDSRAVVERLQKDSYFPIRVVPHAERARWLAFGVSARVGQRDLLALTQQLATLVESALPLDRALAIQEELAPNPRVKAIVGDLLNSVRGGSSLSEALAKHHPARSRACTSTWYVRARRAASSRSRCGASPSSSRRAPRSPTRSSRRSPTPW